MIEKRYRKFELLILTSMLCFYFLQTICHRILYSDGAHVLYQSILYKDFSFFEVARQSLRFWSTLPIVVTIQNSSDLNIETLSYLFSLGIYGIQFICYFGCYKVLPEKHKNLFLFPSCQWLFGVVLNSGLPTIETHLILSLFWYLLFFIQFADFNRLISRIGIIFLGITLIRSHELTSVLGLILGYFSMKRAKLEKGHISLILFLFTAIALLSSLLSFYYIAVPTHSGSRSEFFRTFFTFEFLFLNDQSLNLPVLLSILSSGVLFLSSTSDKIPIGKVFISIFHFLILFTGAWLLYLFISNPDQLSLDRPYLTRVWTAASVILILGAYWLSPNLKWSKNLLGSLMFSGLILMGIQIHRGLDFYKFIQQTQKQLSLCHGKIDLNTHQLSFSPKRLENYWIQWTAPQMSMLLSPQF